MNPQHQQKRIIRQSCHHKFYPQPLFNFSYKRPTFAFTSESGPHTRLSEKDRTQRLTRRNTGRFRWGVVSLPSERSARSQTSPGRVSERRTLLLWELGQVRSRRTQKASGTAMRLCASLSRGVAAPLGCVIFFRFCRNCGLYILRTDMVVGAHSSVLYIDNHLVHKYKTCYLCVCGFFQQNQNARIQKFNLVNL